MRHFGVGLVGRRGYGGLIASLVIPLLVVVDDGGEGLLRLEEVLVVEALPRPQACPTAAPAAHTVRVWAAARPRPPLLGGGQVSGGRLVSPLVRVVLGVGGAALGVAHLYRSPASQDGRHVSPAEPGALALRVSLLLLLNLLESYACKVTQFRYDYFLLL